MEKKMETTMLYKVYLGIIYIYTYMGMGSCMLLQEGSFLCLRNGDQV